MLASAARIVERLAIRAPRDNAVSENLTLFGLRPMFQMPTARKAFGELP
jgi:hypothetical protein